MYYYDCIVLSNRESFEKTFSWWYTLDKLQFVKRNTKNEHRKTDRWPAPCAYSQRSFYPQNQKSLPQWQKRKPFSPSSDIVHWFEGDFLRKQDDRCSSKEVSCLPYFRILFSESPICPYLKLQQLFAVIHLSHPCNRVSEKVYLFSVANGWAIGIWFCVPKSYFVILGYVRKRH